MKFCPKNDRAHKQNTKKAKCNQMGLENQLPETKIEQIKFITHDLGWYLSSNFLIH